MLAVLLMVFVVCWLPYHSYSIAAYLYPEMVSFKHIQVKT
jgi:hypothetical protein